MIHQNPLLDKSMEPLQVQVKPKKAIFIKGATLANMVGARFNIKPFIKQNRGKKSTENNKNNI